MSSANTFRYLITKKLLPLIISHPRRMSVFTQVYNPINGKLEWGIQREDYDYKQEVARSAYADMLHDKERNDKYFAGLKSTVADLRREGKEVHVLDIGTGTGLLSLMAVSCGADSVTACEAFTPMAKCAARIFEINGCTDKVLLIPKRSTEIIVGEDMKRRANVLITEVFDTELIGEGALETFRHAKEHLLTEDAKIIPSEATVYAQVVSSNVLKRWNKLEPLHQGSTENNKVKQNALLEVPTNVDNCAGCAGVHDIQLSEVNPEWFKVLTPPVPVFWFDWSGRKKAIINDEVSKIEVTCTGSGSCDAVLMWWDLKMDQQGEVHLSCAPFWSHPLTKDTRKTANSSDIPWRDHWMQAVYYLPHNVTVKEGEMLTLVSSHDEYSLWFDFVSNNQIEQALHKRPVCDCGLHLISRTRLGQMNDPTRRNLLLRQLEKHVTSDTVCLCLGDSCLMAIAVAKLGAAHVYISEKNIITKRLLQQFIKYNKVEDKVTILDDCLSSVTNADIVAPINLVFGEPYFETSLLPWHSLYFWYLLKSASHLLHDNVITLPRKMVVWAMPVQYRDLWKIRAPLDQCSGFTMNVFDKLIESASNEADEKIEPHPLWEYPSHCLAPPQQLISIDMSTDVTDQEISSTGSIPILGTGTLNGLSLWANWHFDDDEIDVITTGPVKQPTINQQITWDLYTRQGVYLIENQIEVESSSNAIEFNCDFHPQNGTISFDFSVKNCSQNNTCNGKSC